MFSGFLVIYITFRIALGRQIFRSIRETWFNLFVAIGLLVVFNYFSSTFFYTLFSDAPDYGPICTNLYRCFLLLVDQSLKSG